MDLTKAFVTVVSGVLFLVFLSFLLSWPVYALWNGCLVDAVEGVKQVSWLQAWGLNILAGFLFKSTTNTKG